VTGWGSVDYAALLSVFLSDALPIVSDDHFVYGHTDDDDGNGGHNNYSCESTQIIYHYLSLFSIYYLFFCFSSLFLIVFGRKSSLVLMGISIFSLCLLLLGYVFL
jgi:hypothetical protein